MSAHDWITIIAIIAAPILAIQAESIIQRKREKKQRKIDIFTTLMATRATPLSQEHVEALNKIDIEYYDNSSVRELWKALLDCYANFPQNQSMPNFQNLLDTKREEAKDRLSDLLYEMAKTLGYKFDKVHLKRAAYLPRGHFEETFEKNLIRKGILGLLGSIIKEKSIPVSVANRKDKTGV